ISKCRKLIIAKFPELTSAKHHAIEHQERRRDFRVTVLARMDVEHELRQRAFKPGEATLQNHKPRARQFRGDLEVHLAERFPKLEMLLWRERVIALRGEAMMLQVVAGVFAVGHIVERHIRDLRERIVECLRGCLFPRLQSWNGILQSGDLRHQLGGLFLAFAFLGLADLLRGGVAARLCTFKFENFFASLLIHCDQPLGLRRQPAPLERAVKNVGVLANEADVVHSLSFPNRHGRDEPGHDELTSLYQSPATLRAWRPPRRSPRRGARPFAPTRSSPRKARSAAAQATSGLTRRAG